MAKLIPDQLSMFPQATCKTSPNATSSQASEGGAAPCASQDGQTTAQSGPAPARANLSRSPGKDLVPTIHGTCGPTSFGSSVPDGPLSSWESRLRERLAMVGSTELPLTWKVKTTPAGRSISRLAPSMRRTSEAASTGLQATWPTPRASPNENRTTTSAPSHGKTHGLVLAGVAADTHRLSTWPTPRASENSQGPANAQAMADAGSSWLGQNRGATVSTVVMLHTPSGPTPSGSQEPTEKRAALNPQFPCWLMGYPQEWDACAPTAMPSSRKSQQK